jgi:hypothetical protein
MIDRLLRERIKYFLIGVLVVTGVVFLMGTKPHEQVVLDSVRYHISAWGDSRAHGAFVVDTISGETKIVYRYKETGDGGFRERNNLNKPFSRID